MTSSSRFIELQAVTATYQEKQTMLDRLKNQSPIMHTVLQGVTFELELGEHVVLFGRASSGKSTLLRLMMGAIQLSSGRIRINNQLPAQVKHIVAGYVSTEEKETQTETVGSLLNAFGARYNIPYFPARLGEVSEILHLDTLLYRPVKTLSTTERFFLNIAKAALSHSPLILLDDVADHVGADRLSEIINTLFTGRTVIVATRQPEVAEALSLPILLLHHGMVTQRGTMAELAEQVSTPRTLHVWIEGIRYDIVRVLRKHTGVIDVRLLPCSEFSGQQLEVKVRSARYLPGIYDVISHTPVVRIEEKPFSLASIIEHLPV